MKTLSILKISFDAHIQQNEISAFRSAFYQKLGTPKNQNINLYPLIQFKTQQSYDQQQPLMVCLGNHPALFQKMSEARDWKTRINGREVPLRAAYVKSSEYEIKLNRALNQYKLFNYMGLDGPSWNLYKQLEEEGQKALLSLRIKKHLNHFVEAIGWNIEANPEVIVDRIKREKKVRYMGVSVLCLDLAFSSNIFLPEYIGLGKGVNKGFGVVRK